MIPPMRAGSFPALAAVVLGGVCIPLATGGALRCVHKPKLGRRYEGSSLMPEYGTCECFICYRRVPKPEARRIAINRERGHSSGSFRFSRNSTSYYTGRTYYAKQDVW
jgi:hypothetical protein